MMKHGLALLGLIALFVMIMPAGAYASCQGAAARPVVRISTSETPVAFDVKHSVAQLSRMDIDTRSPYPAHYHVDVGGVMSGGIVIDHKMRFQTLADEQDGQGCVVLKAVEVQISIDPKIYIARDFQNQACWFKEIFAHETKHVAVDRKLIEKYKTRFADGLNMILLEPADYSTGPVHQTDLHYEQKRLQTDIEHAMAVLFKNMIDERQRLQQDVDNRHEYDRIRRTCQVSS